MILPLLEGLRPRQWTKNLILFAPLLFARRLADPLALGRTVAAFAVFCLLSGVIYLLNDLRDLEQDRRHPLKSRRPLASGRLSPAVAWAALVGLAALALATAWLLSPGLLVEVTPANPILAGSTTRTPSFFAWGLGYVALQAGYSFGLKNLVILDVMAIAMGFVVRAAAGAAVIPVDISHWLLICTIFLSLFLALSKRRHELVLLADGAHSHRPILAEYDTGLLDQMIGIVAAACVISYALYTMAPETVAKFHTDRLNLTIPFVVYGLFRYLYLVHRRAEGGDPSVSLLEDRPILVAVVLWGLAVVAVLYL